MIFRGWSYPQVSLNLFISFSMCINLLAWNARGTGGKTFPALIKDLKAKHSLDILVLVETRISGVRASKVLQNLGFPCFECVQAKGFSGGIWVLWEDATFSLEVVTKNKQFMHLKVQPKKDSQYWWLTCVYGSPMLLNRMELWNSLAQIVGSMRDPWLANGDFNAYASPMEKKGGAAPNVRSMSEFVGCIQACNLIDLGFKDPPLLGKLGESKKGLIELFVMRIGGHCSMRLLSSTSPI